MSIKNDPVVIVAAKRTPVGNLLGSLSAFTAPQLGAHAHKAVLAQAKLNGEDIDESFYGCVLQAGIGQAPARQALIAAGIPDSVGAVTINKMCGSGMQSVMMAHDSILAGSRNIMLVGGMESMTNAPYLLKKARQGYRLGHNEIYDHMFMDGLEDAYQKGKPMGHFAELTAKQYGMTREMQDDFALTSLNRGIEATEKKYFSDEIVAIDDISQDEGVNPAKREKIARLKPVFSSDGTITAANASSISDGAASLILMRLSEAKKRSIEPLAKIVAHATHAHAPEWFTTAPVRAIEKVLTSAQWTKDDVDLFEINEAFAIVTMVAMEELDIPHEKVNINGGACVLGHPIGASGARLLVTLLYALKQRQLKRGLASLCIGGGEATAMAIECM
jgi:acetyl-CoA C-acetyltransferase